MISVVPTEKEKQFSPILELREVSVVREGDRLVDRITLSIGRGEHTAIVGPNGSGKSTLVKLISGQLYPSAPPVVEPPIRLFGRDRWNIEELRGRMGLVSTDQHHRYVSGASFGRATGLEAVLASFFGSEMLFLHRTVTEAQRAAAFEALRAVGAETLANRKMHRMSTGEARRVLIARALVHQPELLVLDEPTTGLDPVARRDFIERLRGLASAERTLLLVTHHVDEIIPEIRRVLVMGNGCIVADGPPMNVLSDDVLTTAFGTPLSVRRAGSRFEMTIGEVI